MINFEFLAKIFCLRMCQTKAIEKIASDKLPLCHFLLTLHLQVVNSL